MHGGARCLDFLSESLPICLLCVSVSEDSDKAEGIIIITACLSISSSEYHSETYRVKILHQTHMSGDNIPNQWQIQRGSGGSFENHFETKYFIFIGIFQQN